MNDEETFGFGTEDEKRRRSSALHHQIEDELRHEIEEDERTIRTTREFLGVTMFVLLLSVVANFGFTWYAARVLNSTALNFVSHSRLLPCVCRLAVDSNKSTSTEGDYLTSAKTGHRLRVDRSLDSANLSSTLESSTFNKLEVLNVVGIEGEIGVRVQAWGRYNSGNSVFGSVVVLYTQIGSIELDGTQMMFTETAAHAFERAGFETARVYRRDVDNQHQHRVKSAASIIGLFSFLSELEQSAASQAFGHTPANLVSPFNGTTVVFLQINEYLRCQLHLFIVPSESG